ncbi:MAG: hypothetical protein CMH23_02970 [Methylophaga sp.]|jgi:hypothetical protein|uniref:DUF2971 domain-containing protein n=1 Tax=Methylophaga sp. TaxID=2024840 RepID=UPI000C91CCEA|nr:DUF2971 domain-containing protein [Methylophaga sp.]MBN45416.1 hypothetical protein [Methylophaga sp.]|tara:strand:- start:15217 stop:16146 length:930 start_codon:yes stop_codon:yes gene_type:complete
MRESNPEIIYRYQAFNALSLDALCHDQLYFSDPTNFNDPLDCNPAVERDSDRETLRQILSSLIQKRVEKEVTNSLQATNLTDKISNSHAKEQAQQSSENELRRIEHYATNPDYTCSVEEAECGMLHHGIHSELLKQNNRGICCFSAEYSNPLLWSHYGDQHKGFCVGYSLNRNPEPSLHKVLYGGARTIKTSLIAKAVLHHDIQAQKALDQNTLLRKAEPWQYEQEWRLIGEVGIQDSPLCLVEIIFGLRCSLSVIHAVMNALKPRDISFYQMSLTGDSFELRRSDTEDCGQLPLTARSGIEIFGPCDD